jgi:hypothetical protein
VIAPPSRRGSRTHLGRRVSAGPEREGPRRENIRLRGGGRTSGASPTPAGAGQAPCGHRPRHARGVFCPLRITLIEHCSVTLSGFFPLSTSAPNAGRKGQRRGRPAHRRAGRHKRHADAGQLVLRSPAARTPAPPRPAPSAPPPEPQSARHLRASHTSTRPHAFRCSDLRSFRPAASEDAARPGAYLAQNSDLHPGRDPKHCGRKPAPTGGPSQLKSGPQKKGGAAA